MHRTVTVELNQLLIMFIAIAVYRKPGYTVVLLQQAKFKK